MNRFSARPHSSRLALWALALVCVAAFSLMLWAACTDSAIDDELAHIPAGYGYVHNLDYRLNPEHPPLIKALAMLPVLFLNPSFPTTSTAWTAQVNGEWDMGTQFLYESGNNANLIIDIARVAPILITILTIILIYFLAKKLMGDWWALLPATLFAFSPTILAQGHYVTTDVGAAFGVTLATYFFLAFMEAPTTRRLWLAGLALGVAETTKFSTPLLLPLFFFVMLALWIRTMITEWGVARGDKSYKAHATYQSAMVGWRYLRSFMLIVVIAYAFVVYPIYFLFTAHYPIAKQVSDTQAILTSFANGPTPAGQSCEGMRCLADLDIWAAHSPILRPYAEYLLGVLMVLQRTDGSNTIYFLGRVVATGGWIYFPTLYFLKEPIPSIFIVMVALFLALWMVFKRAKNAHFRVLRPVLDYIALNLPEFTMGSFVAFYWAYSLHSPLNLGIRYLIPTFPFIYILAAGVWKKWIISYSSNTTNLSYLTYPWNIFSDATAILRSFVSSAFKYLLLIVMVMWLLFETFFAAPYFLSYFNEFAGGTMNGYHYVTDSNYDWGQDLLRLQSWANTMNNDHDNNDHIDKIAVDYFGGGNPKYYLGSAEVNWSSSKGNPLENRTGATSSANSTSSPIHWLAVSVNTLEVATQPLAPGLTRNASDTYSWLVQWRPPQPGMGDLPPPDFIIGTSIFVYHLQ